MARELNRTSVDELLHAITPSQVAEALGIAVVRRGATLRCICPFHDDHDPSLNLYDSWKSGPPHHHCWVCGAHGDIFDLVRHVRHASFIEAAEWLRSTFGLPQRNSDLSRKRIRRKDGDRLAWDGSRQAAFNYAAEVYKRKSETPELIDWLDSRHLPQEIASKAGLSFSPVNTLIDDLKRTSVDDGERRIETAMLEEIGLIQRMKKTSDSSELFADTESRFRDFFFDARVVFPIQSLQGTLIGFAGRAVNDSKRKSPKYLYTPGLAKSSVLYRGHAALEALKVRAKAGEPKEIFICEGLVDALRLESCGYPAVSILGSLASKEQIQQLRLIADTVAPANDLLVHIFLDRDKAGVRGSSKLAVALAQNEFDADFIWPTKGKLAEYGVLGADEKDPDSLLSSLGSHWNDTFIGDSAHPTAFPVIAAKLDSIHSPDDLLNDEKWNSISLGARYRAATQLTRDDSEAKFLFRVSTPKKPAYEYAWLSDVVNLRASRTSARDIQREGRSADFIANETSRLNVARILAKSGADRGEVPTDEAAWRRLDVGATAFNTGFLERLQETTFEPLEPFDAVYVARDFEKTEPRLKAMPCPEDLVLQQYMLSEVLTERFDVTEESDAFSRSIPAVRFYRSRKETITTAENGHPGANAQTLSFAYQVDMDVLEGRSTASNQGMFRPYIECWREFIASLRTTANGFEEVYALRLDLKRYYDRLYRTTVRDALKGPFSEGIQRLKTAERFEEFAPSFRAGRQNLSDSVVDWFCEQSFGYQYYHPETGRITKSEANVGIPQGPILSAWLATVALFPLDSALRNVLESINVADSLPHAGYARYVDDIFLIADSPQILEQLRAAVEDACTRLRLDAVPKGELAPRMTPEEFRELLTQGTALIGSGPAREVGLLPLGDGEAGFETWQDPIQRASALVLLSDRRLYEADVETIKKQVFTALNAHDLRPAELSKAARWIWYAVAKESHETPDEVWHAYWEMWREVTERLAARMKVDECPWHDPSLYGLDGLERLFSSASTYDRNLSISAEAERRRWIAALSKVVLCDGFFAEFVSPQRNPPPGAGKGVGKLRRMFFQRGVCVRWIARQLQGAATDTTLEAELGLLLGLASQELSASLVRARLTDADGANSPLDVRSNDGDPLDWTSPLRPLFLWLHEAIVLLGRNCDAGSDPLETIRGKLQESPLYKDAPAHSKFYGLLNLWKADLSDDELWMEELRLDALASLLAVCPMERLMHCLQRRPHLLQDIGRPLPALPGIAVRHLVLKTTEDVGTCLKGLTHLIPTGTNHPLVDYRVASANQDIEIQLDWVAINLPVDTVHLTGRRADWTVVANKIKAAQPSKVEEFGFKELRWAADLFESLARVNHDLELDSGGEDAGVLMEFVPAWPFISASRWLEDTESGDALFSLFGPVVPKTHLANFAFARDGKGRLRSYEVPLADARLWRIGYAVTDALGMVDELERFRALETDGRKVDVNTAQYVLSRLLGRLRGDGQPSTSGLPHPARRHLTGSTYRALQLLRNFPVSGDVVHEAQYLLSVEAETAVMRLQGNGHSDSSRPGVLASLLSELAPAVFFRLTEKQLRALPAMASANGPNGTERRVVAAWRLLDRRLEALESSLVGGVPPESLCAWIALRRSVRVAAVVAWVRALVFEIYLAGDATPTPHVEVPSEWAVDEPVLFIDTSDVNIGALFRDAMAPKGRLAITSRITPLGWLALLNNQLNLYGTDASRAVMSEGRAEALRPLMTSLALQLATACSDEELEDAKWPFDACAKIENVLDEPCFESSLGLLFQIESELGYTVRKCESSIWGLQPQSKTFTDQSGRQWNLLRGLIDQIGRDRHVETVNDDNGQRIWTETATRDGKLIGVSVLGETFAKTAGMQGHHSLFDTDQPDNWAVHLAPRKKSVQLQEPAELAPSETSEPVERAVEAGSAGSARSPTNDRVAAGDAAVEAEFFRRFREYQDAEWKARRTGKSAGHIRVALFQFRIDDSYYHPINDVGFPEAIDRAFCKKSDIDFACNLALSEIASEKVGEGLGSAITTLAQRAKASLSMHGMENQWGLSKLLPSWNEHRRRRLIEEALRACRQFEVDVLVLPEYSVRPDTVEWLRQCLVDLGDKKLSVVAGTYRLHGTPKDLYFKESFEKIFGVEDKTKVFSPSGNSMEKSAYITLLQPIPDAGPGAVGVFSRRKKYHSMAMGEYINPSDEQWAPLASLEGLVQAIQKEREISGAPLMDVNGVTTIAKQIRPVERMAELICSELFASTHPVNHSTILSEYRALRQRFGFNSGAGEDVVTKDVGNLTKALRLDGNVDRRTILVVPACTTRSADYWVYGQSALLAAGLTTVFCAAVLADAKIGFKGGGSCLIAGSSWSTSSEKPGHLTMTTPYSGWSRGVYYNRSEDVLSRKEQAVVIADIDPIYMNEGKPRQQALPVPIQLVAHLPLIEMIDAKQLESAYTSQNGGFRPASPKKNQRKLAQIQNIAEVASAFREVEQYLVKVKSTHLVDSGATLSNGEALAERATGMKEFFSEPSGWSNRLDCWTRNWREMPFYGPPPALIDWLPVDLSPKDGTLPCVFVPPWGADSGGPVALAVNPEDA